MATLNQKFHADPILKEILERLEEIDRKLRNIESQLMTITIYSETLYNKDKQKEIIERGKK